MLDLGLGVEGQFLAGVEKDGDRERGRAGREGRVAGRGIFLTELVAFSASSEVMAAPWYVIRGNFRIHNSNIKFIGHATGFCTRNALYKDVLCMGFTWKERLISRRTLR